MQPVNAESTSVRPALLRASRIPLVFILVSLLALGVLPVVGDRYVDIYRRDVRERVEPARNLLTEVHVSLALGSTALRDFLNTGDTTFLERYSAATMREQRAYRALAPLAQLGADVLATYNRLRLEESRWHSRVRELLHNRPRDMALIRRVFAEERLYENTVTAAASLDDALADASVLRRARIDRAERVIRILSLVLAVLAGSAGLIALSLGRRLQLYAQISEERRLELEEVLASRASLSRSITHDLKNPLNVILGHMQLLEQKIEGDLTPAQQDRIRNVVKAAALMLDLINSLLEVERLRSGQLEVQFKDVDLATFVEEVAEHQRAAVEAAGLRLDIDIDQSIGRVATDPGRLRRILENILSNAVKYSDEGYVRVSAATSASPARGPGEWIVITVEDTGRGIPREQLGQIFQEFSRLESGTIPGSGLGLAVSSRLARMLGGDLTVQSEVGKGSMFSLWLPRARDVIVRDRDEH
jgi:signal transduction histidine kinase